MFKYLKAIVLFFLPALKEALAQTTVEAIDKIIHGDTPRRRPYAYKNGRIDYGRPKTMEEQDRLVRERVARVQAGHENCIDHSRPRTMADAYEEARARHENIELLSENIINVAFKVHAHSPELAVSWLKEVLPEVGSWNEGTIDLNSWWITKKDD